MNWLVFLAIVILFCLAGCFIGILIEKVFKSIVKWRAKKEAKAKAPEEIPMTYNPFQKTMEYFNSQKAKRFSDPSLKHHKPPKP